MIELKPCPFCGEEAVTTYNTLFKFQVFCTNDECFMNTITMSDKETEEEAIKAWNKRVNEDVPTIDVVERKRGKWVKLDNNSFHCQLCGHTFIVIQGENFMNYCPSCGADMI